ncbi:unnamed protein product [Sphenostylis stenocarpa]|uniref:Uncharacterized protein n=1 Tax=Sphenostylis stenocarpa TaxID=92480 RepID=A0AA86VWM7_9FABA|nr:unnamed protein product [Sphenostylis stenocarpa]
MERVSLRHHAFNPHGPIRQRHVPKSLLPILFLLSLSNTVSLYVVVSPISSSPIGLTKSKFEEKAEGSGNRWRVTATSANAEFEFRILSSSLFLRALSGVAGDESSGYVGARN